MLTARLKRNILSVFILFLFSFLTQVQLSAQTLDATFSVEPGELGNFRLKMVLNQPATFQFSGNYSNAQNAFSLIIKNLYNSTPTGGTANASGLTYTTSGGKSGSAIQMGTYGLTFGPFIHTTDEVIVFSLAPSATIASGETLTIPAGTVIQGLPGSYTAGQTFNAGPYTAIIANSAFDGVGATMIPTPISNNAPTIGSASAGQIVNDNVNISPFSGITIADSDGDNLTATISLDNNAKGVITGASSGSGPYTISSRSPAAMQTAIRALVFNPTDNRTSSSETTTFTIVVNDGTDNATNNTTTVISNAVAPTVTSVAVPSDGTYTSGQNLNFTINFSETISVNTGGGIPQMSLVIGATTRQAVYQSGSGTNALLFRYTVLASELDNDGIAVGTLSANGGTLKDSGTKDALLTLNSVGNTSNVKVDAVRPTATVSISDAALKAGETATVTITFSEAVTGFTNADLTIPNGTLTAVSSADGGITWTATFTPTAGITDATNVITLDNTGVSDAAGNTGTGTTDSGNFTIDTARPTATVSMSDAALKAGETATVTITFSEAVTGFTNSDLTIPNGTLTAVSSADGGTTWTSTFTPTAGTTDATNVITLDNTGVTDAAGNTGTGTTDSGNFTIDTARPTATVSISNAALKAGETATVTTTFSEAVTGFTNADLTIPNGTLTAVSSADGGTTWTATFTPTAGITDATNVITLDNTGVTDAAGNTGTGTTDSGNFTIDTARPTATVSISDAAIQAGETATVTITFSEAVTGFTNADLTIPNGTLTAVSSADGGTTWTATFTPTAGTTDATNVISLDNTGVTDAAGNTGTGTTDSGNFTIDTARPTATVSISDAAIQAGETATVTITFSEAVTGFTNADLTIPNGTLTAVSSADGGTTWTATFTPTAGTTDATNVISLDNTGVSDAAGNTGTGTTDSGNFTIDTARPTATVSMSDAALKAGETATVTITFSEAVSGFTNADLTIPNGTLTAVSSADGGTTWTATFTPTAGTADATNVITLDNTGVTDAAGNTGTGTTSSGIYSIQTVRPSATISISDAALKAGETATVTITFSEAVTGFTNADLTIPNGTLTAVSSADGGTTWTATFTPTAGITDATNLISLDNSGVTNSVNNTGIGTTDSGNFTIDTARPTATVSMSDAALKAGETATVTITFSEAVTGFTNSDLTIPNGTLTAVSSADGGTTWTSTFTPTAGTTDATNVITLDNTGVTDAAGNTGTGTTDSGNFTIDTARPTATVSISNAALKAGETATVTTTFSEAVTGFTNADLTIPNGTLTAVSSADGGTTWTATFTPTAGITDATNVITLDNTGVTDAAGNTGTGTTDSGNFTIDTARPTATVSISDAAIQAGETATVTITFSEAVTGFTNADLTIPNGTLTAVSSADGGTTWTATFTPTAGTTDATNVISLDNTGVTDAAGNTGTGTTDSGNFTIDTARPTATVSISDAAIQAGETATVTITFSEAVTGFTNADLTIPNGTLTAVSSADGGTTWTATFTPTAGTTDATNVITLDNTGVTDAAGNAGTGTTDSGNYVIDTAVPTITSVTSSKTDGTYGLGESIAITITFDEALTVTGTPQLELETGAVDRKVDYSSGTGTNTLTFNYSVQMGDESADLDYIATNALTLNGGTIKDPAGNDATLTLAAPGAANSLGNNKALVVEAFPTVTLSVGSASITEASGTSTVTATLSAVSSQDVIVTLAYSGTATNGTDYNNTASTSITVPAGGLSANASIGITATQDANPETNETIIIDITGVTKGTENGTQQQTITITDDDTPNLSFTSTTSSGLESVSSANITVDLNIASALTVTVGYTVTGTASSGTDYTLANGTLTFNPADVQKTITIASIVDDAILESNETVIVTLSNPSNANLGANAAHTYTITDNDAAAVTIADVSGAENGGAITLTATLDNAVQGGFMVEVSTADGTATTADSDYTTIAGQTLTFVGTAGETQTFTITPTADTKLEANETVTISQSNLAATSLGVTITDGATVTITNDDNASVTIADVSGSENGGAITLTATLDNAVQGGFTVDVNTADGTALAASDYTAVTSQTLTFLGTVGETQTFTVTPTNDAVEEVTETLTVSMNNLAATTLGVTITDNATVTITDDDDNTAPTGFTITISDALIAASETSTTKFTFAGAEVGTTYNYTVSSNNGGTNVTGTGTIATATDEITINNLSGLNDGTLTLSVTLTDGSSNTSTAQTATSQLDKTAPAAPVVTGVSADSGSSSSDGITSDTTPDVKGTAEANASIEVFVGGNSVGTTTADGSGDWTLAYSGVNPLADGTISVTAKATDAAGNTSSASTAVNVTIDATAPAAPVITSITPDSGTSTTDKITNDETNLTITGTGEANSQLEITVNGTTYSGLPVDGSGNWSIAVGAILGTDGTYPVTATVTDAAGNQSAASAAFSIIYDTTAPAAPTVDLDAASDLGQSNTDNITHYNATDGLMLSGTAEANAAIELSLRYNGITFSGLTAAADGSGNWTFDAGAIVSGVLADGTVNNLVINAQATDAAGNQGTAGTLTVVLDQQMTATLSPADNAIDILPSANLTMAFGEDVFKGTGNITIKQKSDDSIIETIPVSAVTISSGTVTIDPVNLILPPATEFYINIAAGALTDIAGNSYTISNNTDWSFTIIASSVVTSVAISANATYKIGDELDFTANFTLPITITGTPSIPVMIGASTKAANLKAAVNNSSTAIFSYTIAEGDLDTDGIAIGAAISLNGGTIKDQFGTDAQLALNNVASTTAVLVDGVKPTPTITTAAGSLINGAFTATFTYDEAVTGFVLGDIAVTNGTASNFTSVTAGTVWSATITPTVDGTTTVTLGANVANDAAGNPSKAGNTVSTTFDGTAPTVTSITRAEADQIPTGTTSRNFTVIFSENVTGVDATDFEVVTTGTATGTVNTITAVDAKTYTVNVNGISGEGTIGLNAKSGTNIADAATNTLSAGFTGQVYTTNFAPTDIALSSTSIQENNAVGAEIATLSTTDADAGDSFTYSLVAGTGDTDNAAFTLVGNSLNAAAVFDFETKASYSIRVRTQDGFGGSYEEVITITITNEPEAIIVVDGDGNFEPTILGLSSTKSWTATNNGDAATEVRVISSAQGFSISPGSIQLAPGETRNITAVFRPTEARLYNGLVVFNFDITDEIQDNVIEVGLTGEGVIVTGVDNEQISEAQISLYPNPSTTSVTIDLSELNGIPVNIQMINSTGISKLEKQNFDKAELIIDVTNFESGLYILQFSNGKSLVRKKVLIKK